MVLAALLGLPLGASAGILVRFWPLIINEMINVDHAWHAWYLYLFKIMFNFWVCVEILNYVLFVKFALQLDRSRNLNFCSLYSADWILCL